MSNEFAVVVTTEHRGVFFGYLDKIPDLNASKAVTLKNARMCVYWDKKNRGVLGLGADGPIQGGKVSPAVPEIVLAGVTSVMTCTEKAAKVWETEPWS